MPRSHAPVRSALLALALTGSSLGLAGIAPAFADSTVPTTATTTTVAPTPAGGDASASTSSTSSTSSSTASIRSTDSTGSTAKVAGGSAVSLAAVPSGTPTQRAAAYLVAHLKDGTHVVGPYGTDLGQTADVIIGLTAARAQTPARDAAAAYLAAHVDDYVHGAAFVDGTAAGEKAGANYAGPTGKAILAALAAGQDPTAFGGFDLVSELTALMSTSGAEAGRFKDDSAFGDYSNPLGQAFDILALERATAAGAPASAVTYLLRAQCADGGFSDAWPASKKACTSSPDSTGLALQALIATGSDCAATEALAWLRKHAAKDGSFVSAATAPGAKATANVNSTAYAALGLTAAKQGTTAQVTYLTKVQNADGGLPIVATAKDRSSNLLATVQAVLALSKSSMLSIGSQPIAAKAPTCRTSTPSATTATATSTPGGTTGGDAGTLPQTGGAPVGPLLTSLVLMLTGTGALLLGRRPLVSRARHR